MFRSTAVDVEPSKGYYFPRIARRSDRFARVANRYLSFALEHDNIYNRTTLSPESSFIREQDVIQISIPAPRYSGKKYPLLPLPTKSNSVRQANMDRRPKPRKFTVPSADVAVGAPPGLRSR